MKNRAITPYRLSTPGKAVYTLLRLLRAAVAAALLLLLQTLSAPLHLAAQSAPIALKAEPLPFVPKEFYIADVVDERGAGKPFAYLLPLPASPTSPPGKPVPVELAGGGLKAVRQFLQQGAPRQQALRPVVIRVKECQVTEKPGARPGRVEGQITMDMAFEYQRGEQVVPLMAYRGGARYDRPTTQQDVVAPTLQRVLADALVYLNTWMEHEAGSNEKLARALQVTFRDHTHDAGDDSVFYSPARPLAWADFKGQSTKPTKFAAAVFPSFSYEGRPQVIDGVIQLELLLKVYVLKSSSWVKEPARNAYGLNHEQRHFDIVRLVAERFKQKLHPGRLTLEDYNSIIQYEYIESFREMNRLQEQYDTETRHGLDEAAQERWNKRISEELRAIPLGQASSQ
ncbi:hypothetical protein MKJ04_01160 [Pontibacter sp. E15-1]|uniref:hypothetical protein n=1 Tax=Pontibacter sp. E15-1 TaxID=2919918 RepID=UPI001F4F5524|nr:hypothetical protein [Pontibacter sp. E15-1]MCJ8163429.1 hypothetical protein [Pontibacter sp. E15-1]